MRQYGGPTPSTFSIVAQVLAELMVDILGRSCDNLTREGVMHATLNEIRGWRSGLLVEGAAVTLTDKDRRAPARGSMERVHDDRRHGRRVSFRELGEFREE